MCEHIQHYSHVTTHHQLVDLQGILFFDRMTMVVVESIYEQLKVSKCESEVGVVTLGISFDISSCAYMLSQKPAVL